MPRRRTARDRLRERFEEPGGYAFARLAGGREMFATGTELAERAGPDVPVRPGVLTAQKRLRERMLGARERSKQFLAAKAEAARRGPVTVWDRLAQVVEGMDPVGAKLYARHPGLRPAIEADLRRQRRIAEQERAQGYKKELAGIHGTAAIDLLGRRFGYIGKVESAKELGRQLRAAKSREQQERERVSRERVAGETAEAKAASATGKAETRKRERAEAVKAKRDEAKYKAELTKRERKYKRLGEYRENLEKRVEKLKDIVAQEGSTAADKRHYDAAVKKLMDFDGKKELDRALEELDALQPPGATEEPERPVEETITPEMPGGEVVTPEMVPGEQPAPAPPEYRTSSEVITAIRGGQIDMAAPGGAEVFLSLDPNAQEEVRAWLRRNGYLE